ncbi:MAG: hypothetical protein IMW91_10450, partial [Firmicutes bacterium]|nr:hypothetical protein [Bacillota bacterium]
MKGRTSLPVHLHDQALFDAVGTMQRYIASAITHSHLKGKLFSRFSDSESQQHYAFRLLHGYERIGQVLRGTAPKPPFPISQDQRHAVACYLRRALRQALGRRPRVHIKRSFMLDDTLYLVFEQHTSGGFSRQYIKITTLSPRKCIVPPLRGKGRLSEQNNQVGKARNRLYR